MPKFKYRAMSPSGEKISSSYEADSRDEVISIITANGYYPLKIEEVSQSKSIELNILSKVTLKDISVFCRQFYTMIDAGITIDRALKILSNQTTNKRLKIAIKNIDEDVSKGEILSAAMKKNGDIFPKLLINMIEVGEVTGNLDQVMLRMADQYEKENKINNKVKVAMIYPAVLGIVAILVVIIMMTFVMPKFLDVFKDMNMKLPAITRILITTSNSLSSYALIIWPIIIAVIIGIRIYFKTEHGIYSLSVIKLKIPVIKNLNKKIIVSRFTRTLSVLLSSGIPLIKSLELIGELLGNKLAEKEVLTMIENVTRGEDLYNSIKRSNIFPEMLSTMIKIGEETGALDEILYKTADFYDDEVESQIQITASLVEPMLIVFMGGVIAFLVIAIMLPMTNMYQGM